LHQTHQVLILPVIDIPTPIFAKVYIICCHPDRICILSRLDVPYPITLNSICLEQRLLVTLGNWIYEDILCQWGSLCEIVTDNDPTFLKSLEYLARCYHLNHICISSYNSQANDSVERVHFDICQSLFKAVNGAALVDGCLLSILG
jgi:hypothetical protein